VVIRVKAKFYFIILSSIFLIVFFSLNVSAARLPTVGGDSDAWGTLLNNYLSKALGNNATTLNISGTAVFGNNVNITGDLQMGGVITHDSPVQLREGITIINKTGADLLHIDIHGTGHGGETPLPDALNHSLLFEIHESDNEYNISTSFFDTTINRSLFTINKWGVGRASVFDTSLMVGKSFGNATVDENYTKCQGFNLIDCDTTGTGADLGVEDDIEAKGGDD